MSRDNSFVKILPFFQSIALTPGLVSLIDGGAIRAWPRHTEPRVMRASIFITAVPIAGRPAMHALHRNHHKLRDSLFAMRKSLTRLTAAGWRTSPTPSAPAPFRGGSLTGPTPPMPP